MKKMIMAAAAAMLATSAMAFDVTVGVERTTKAGENTGTVAVSQPFGDLTVTGQADINLDAGSRGKARQFNLDASYQLGKAASVFMENDLDADGKRTETKVGFRYTF